MNIRYCLLTIACAMALSACGGGSSHHDGPNLTSKNSTTTTPAKPDSTTTPTKPDSTTTPAKPDSTTTPAKPDSTTTPAKPDSTTTPAKPDSTTTPAKPDSTTTPAKPDSTTTPAKDKTDPINLSEALKQGFKVGGGNNGPDAMSNFGRFDGKEKFNGIHLTVNNTTGETKGSATPDNQDFRGFKLNGKTFVLLENDIDRNNGQITMRRILSRDFPNGMPAAKDPANPGWIGSLDYNSDKFSSVRFGVFTDADNISHLFVHGTPAPAPVKESGGEFNYEGSAVYGKKGDYHIIRNGLKAKVNFDKNTVDITMALPKEGQMTVDPLRFGGTIKGNVFEGIQNGIETRGGFFGSNDMGGAFNIKEGERKGYHGVFGATIQQP